MEQSGNAGTSGTLRTRLPDGGLATVCSGKGWVVADANNYADKGRSGKVAATSFQNERAVWERLKSSSSLSDFRRKSFVFNDSPFQLETVNTVI